MARARAGASFSHSPSHNTYKYTYIHMYVYVYVIYRYMDGKAILKMDMGLLGGLHYHRSQRDRPPTRNQRKEENQHTTIL